MSILFHRASFIIVGLFISVALHATTFVNRSLGEVAKEASIIARGRAGESFSDWDKSGTKRLYTYTDFTVTEVLKGTLKESKILLRQPGGSKDGIEMQVPGAASFKTDEDIVVLLAAKDPVDSSYDVPGFSTGKFNVTNGENGEPLLVNSMGGGAMYDVAKDPRTQSYNASVPLEVFRRIAKGEDIPEAAHRQFTPSEKAAPPGAFEAGHNHVDHPAALDGGSRKPESEPNAEVGKDSVVWVVVAIAALLGGFGIGLALWMHRQSKRRGIK